MLDVTGLTKSFITAEGTVTAAQDVSFSVANAQCYAMLGPSGCGKTTILRCVAGLEQAERGTIAIGGRVVSDPAGGVFVPVHERPIGMVFQSYAIWPHLDVFENVAYPLEVQRPSLAKTEIAARVMDVLALVGMQAMARRPSTRLSGGQQQRVALARAIVRRPSLLLLDEPLSNLDARLRDAMRHELSILIRQIGITALFVTHDQSEALSLADNLAVMRDGRIIQEGAPAEIYHKPRTLFVAQFLGAANVLSGKVEANDGAGGMRIVLDAGAHHLTLKTALAEGTVVDIVLRSENLQICPRAFDAIPGKIRSLAFQGSHVEYDVDIGWGTSLRVLDRAQEGLTRGAPVWVSIDANHAAVFPKNV